MIARARMECLLSDDTRLAATDLIFKPFPTVSNILNSFLARYWSLFDGCVLFKLHYARQKYFHFFLFASRSSWLISLLLSCWHFHWNGRCLIRNNLTAKLVRNSSLSPKKKKNQLHSERTNENSFSTKTAFFGKLKFFALHSKYFHVFFFNSIYVATNKTGKVSEERRKKEPIRNKR